MNITQTSQAEYEAAQQRHVAAFNAVTAARKALVEAEIELEMAEDALCRHEFRPGVPLYTVTEAQA